MALDSQIENPNSAPAEAAPALAAEAPNLQVGGTEFASLNPKSEIPSSILPQGFSFTDSEKSAEESEEDEEGDNDSPQENFAPSEDKPELRIDGADKKLSPENRAQLDTLKNVADQTVMTPGADLALLQKNLQLQADSFGKNPDGTPKVQILAHQSRDSVPETSFYASFANSRVGHETNQLLLDGARKYGSEFYPAERIGRIGTVPGGSRNRV